MCSCTCKNCNLVLLQLLCYYFQCILLLCCLGGSCTGPIPSSSDKIIFAKCTCYNKNVAKLLTAARAHAQNRKKNGTVLGTEHMASTKTYQRTEGRFTQYEIPARHLAVSQSKIEQPGFNPKRNIPPGTWLSQDLRNNVR